MNRDNTCTDYHFASMRHNPVIADVLNEAFNSLPRHHKFLIRIYHIINRTPPSTIHIIVAD